jgi:multiple sugar transport system ATP-binding protein
LRLIAGLEDVTGGQILIDGKNVVDVPPAKRGLSMVFQSYALYPHMSVRGNIAFGLKMAGLPRPDIDRKVEAAAATLNLTPYLDRKPRELSGGQRQRVAIGRAIVREPKAFCSTSHCRISMRRCASRCGWKSPNCRSSLRPPPSMSPMTRSRP